MLFTLNHLFLQLLYTRIAVCLWRSSRTLEKQLNASTNSANYKGISRSQSSRFKHHYLETKVNREASLISVLNFKLVIFIFQISNDEGRPLQNTTNILPNPNSSQNVLKARRGVIRMLIIVVLTFALCNLPLHARKMWQYWSHDYQGHTNFSAVLTPLTFLVAYFNSGINPLLYAFLSRNFRRYVYLLMF